MLRKRFPGFLSAALIASTALYAPVADACTRTLYVGANNQVVTGRNMDWAEDMSTDLWVFPRGVERTGNAGPGSPTWTSKYGSVIASAYNIASADGMNEKGLVANMLYLAESDYGDAKDHAPISIGLWAQYVLDNYASVDETVKGLTDKPLRIVAPALPNGSAATLHLSISDPTGDSAIIEYIGGKLEIHHGKDYVVMTNSPVYDQQLALNAYWKNIGGMAFLPGTVSAADRYVRASFLLDTMVKEEDKNYIVAVPDQSYPNQAVAQSLSLQRAVAVPLGISAPNEPNIASTLWTTVSDQTDLKYFFSSATTPNVFWVDLKAVDFSAGTNARKLAIAGGKYYAGDATDQFVEAEPFDFMDATATH
ncbi:linear amide C-N hydrolase [Rhodobacteraceae bacterium F11138]|nr:linear amide C-N hydrolase [Rhodobacteraceae bacterium F11138]